MALVKFHDGTKKQIGHDQALALWEVLTGKTEGTPQQEAYCLTVDKLYLDWRTAPDDYLLKYQDTIREFVLDQWMCTADGQVTQPEPLAENNRRIAKIVGLYEHGQPTALAKQLSYGRR